VKRLIQNKSLCLHNMCITEVVLFNAMPVSKAISMAKSELKE